MATYEFKTQEDIDAKSRTIVMTEDVPAIPATTKETSFTLESKESRLISLNEQKTSVDEQIEVLESEIEEIKTALKI